MRKNRPSEMHVMLAMPWDQATGGVTHVAATLGRLLQARGHRVTFLFPSDVGCRIAEGTSLRGFHSLYGRFRNFPSEGSGWRARFSWYSAFMTTLPQLVRRGRELGIDLLNVHYPDDGLALLVDLSHRLGVPLVVSAHGSDLLADDGPRRDGGLLRQLNDADAVVVPSQEYLRSMAVEYPGIRGKLRCIHNGYDEAEIPAAAPARPLQESLVTVLGIAALLHKKGIDVLLHALKQCRSPGLQLRLIGEGPLRQDLEALCAALGLSERVAFLGSRDRGGVLEELARCDLMVMPSRHPSESFGLSALEAMALGKPVVASAIGGLKELVDDGSTGILVPAEHPAALAGAIDRLAGDPALRASMGEAARIRAARFTARATAEAYEALYAELLDRHDYARGAAAT